MTSFVLTPFCTGSPLMIKRKAELQGAHFTLIIIFVVIACLFSSIFLLAPQPGFVGIRSLLKALLYKITSFSLGLRALHWQHLFQFSFLASLSQFPSPMHQNPLQSNERHYQHLIKVCLFDGNCIFLLSVGEQI